MSRVCSGARPMKVHLASERWTEAEQLASSILCGGRHALIHMRNRVWAWG